MKKFLGWFCKGDVPMPDEVVHTRITSGCGCAQRPWVEISAPTQEVALAIPLAFQEWIFLAQLGKAECKLKHPNAID
jgi:hypothetical protein